MKDQLIDTWQIHNHMNLLIIDNITDAGMTKTLSTTGGRTVYEQLAHMHNVRITWLEVCDKELFKKYSALDKGGIQPQSFTQSFRRFCQSY